MNTKNKYALVTGGAQRIGAKISLALAQKKINLIIHYFTSRKEALELQAEVKDKYKIDCLLIQADLSSREELRKFCNKIKEVSKQKEFQLELVVNSASIFENKSFLETDLELFEKTINLNFRAPFFVSQFYASSFQSGQIINILDTEIKKNKTHHFVYQISKKALFEFTKMSALELAPKFRVNCICPGLILPNNEESKELVKKRIKSSPLLKEPDLEYLVKALDYLLVSEFSTGECLFVDNGEHLI